MNEIIYALSIKSRAISLTCFNFIILCLFWYFKSNIKFIMMNINVFYNFRPIGVQIINYKLIPKKMLDKHFLDGSMVAIFVHADERFRHGNKP